MSSFYMETAMLTAHIPSAMASSTWECSALVADNSSLTALSLDFTFSYFNYFTYETYQSPWLSTLMHTAFSVQTFDLFFIKYDLAWCLYLLFSSVRFFNYAVVANLFDLLNIRTFVFADIHNYLFFAPILLNTLYNSYGAFLLQSNTLIYQTAEVVTLLSTQSIWLLEVIYSCDIIILFVELLALCVVINSALRFSNFATTLRLFYDDIITFCQTNNLSVTELGIFFSFCLGFIIFDIFMSAFEEDVTDVFFYFMLCFVILLFAFLIGGIDVQYFYMISSVSAGDLTTRVVVFDVINNFLCVLRIFFCWVRYIFYDLQVELVDFSFHYTDAINDLNAATIFESFNVTSWNNGSFTIQNSFTMLSSLKVTFWLLVYFFIDIAFIIFQIILSFAKLFIAFFLLWLIVDLFILKALAVSESLRLHSLKTQINKINKK